MVDMCRFCCILPQHENFILHIVIIKEVGISFLAFQLSEYFHIETVSKTANCY